MYCKICGNLLDETDTSCKICGTAAERKEKPIEPLEEIVFNPPFEEEKETELFEEEKGPELLKNTVPEPEWLPVPEQVTESVIEPAKLPEQPLEEPVVDFNLNEIPDFKLEPALTFKMEPIQEFKPEYTPETAPSFEPECTPEPILSFKPEQIHESKPVLDETVQETVTEPAKQEQEAGKNCEFAWNIHEFPKSKKTEDITFNWNSDPETPIQVENKEEISPESLEQLLLKENREDAFKNQDSGVEKFFTFSKKNEEFQALLDREYERLRKRNEVDFECEPRFVTLSDENEAFIERDFCLNTEFKPIEDSETKAESLSADETGGHNEPEVPTLEKTSEPALQPESEAEQASAPTAPSAAALTDLPAVAPAFTPITEAPAAQLKASHIEEMSQARALFFGDTIVQDNETIKKKLDSGDSEKTIEEAEQEPAVKPHAGEAESHVGPNPAVAESNPTVAETIPVAAEQEHATKEQVPADKTEEQSSDDKRAPIILPYEGEPETKKKKGCLGKGILIVIAIILVAEISILGIRYFAQDSPAAEAIGKAQSQVVDYISGWFDAKDTENSNDQTNKEKPVDKDKAAEVSNMNGQDTVIPDTTPAADKNELVAGQLYRNKNIAEVKANTLLAYVPNKDYGIADLNQSKPIENNIWITQKDGSIVYYDRSVVGTIISFDSQWIDYVNGSSKSVLDLLKKGGKAYQNAVTYSKIGKESESFQLLEIGEIRQGSNGFYIWVHEEIKSSEKGKTIDKKYNWIYYLEPVDGQMKIVSYLKF